MRKVLALIVVLAAAVMIFPRVQLASGQEMATIYFLSGRTGYVCFLNLVESYSAGPGPFCLSDIGLFPENGTVPIGNYTIIFYPMFDTYVQFNNWFGTGGLIITNTTSYMTQMYVSSGGILGVYSLPI